MRELKVNLGPTLCCGSGCSRVTVLNRGNLWLHVHSWGRMQVEIHQPYRPQPPQVSHITNNKTVFANITIQFCPGKATLGVDPLFDSLVKGEGAMILFCNLWSYSPFKDTKSKVPGIYWCTNIRNGLLKHKSISLHHCQRRYQCLRTFQPKVSM